MKWNIYNIDNGNYIESVISDIQPQNSTNIEILIPVDFAKFTGVEWIDNRTPEEINKIIVPDTISRMGLKIQLRIRNIDISEVEKTIRELPSWMMSDLEKDLAVIKFNDASYYDRYNADLQLIATLMGLTQEDLDTMFINGKST